MSVHRKKDRWVVRWRAQGRQHSKSFRTKREAVEYDRVRQRDTWRDSVAMPQGAVATALANEGASFAVCEDLYEAGSDLRRERPIHEGHFLTIREADSYRQQMPDADALNILVMYDRYAVRDLTDAEIAVGEIAPGNPDDESVKRLLAQDKEGR